jgi:SAM-dependent methyltransferase
MQEAREHWDHVYSTKLETEVSWYQPHSVRSLAAIKSAAPDHSRSIIDIGGGASHLVDDLLSEGYSDVTVLDISEAALNRSRERLGQRSGKVSWIAANIARWKPLRTWDVWHDRAVFHFLTERQDQEAYIAALAAATKAGSVAVIATFALNGPERCSGLPVQRYDPAGLAARIGGEFRLISEASEAHKTPWGAVQHFAYAILKR